MVAWAVLLLASDAAGVVPPATPAARAPRRMIVARLPLRAIAPTTAGPCERGQAELPRPWTPEKDVIGSTPDCALPAIVVTAPGRRPRLAAPVAPPAAAASGRLRLVGTAFPYLRGAVGGGAFAVAVTGRLALARGSRPTMRLDVARGARPGATRYVTAPDPAGLALGRPDRF